MLNTQTIALTFASDLVHGKWEEVAMHSQLMTLSNTHYLECQTARCIVVVCSVTGRIEDFDFGTREDV